MNSASIDSVRATQIFDSRGRPTVWVEVLLKDGSHGSAAVPSGASTGAFEAHELRDGNPAEFNGLGVSRAVAYVSGEILAALSERDALDQAAVDALLIELDGTANLSRLGANACLGVSLAVCRASADHLRVPVYTRISELSGTNAISMPVPMVNILSGGLHAGRGMDIQDFLFIPTGARSIDEAVKQVADVRSGADLLAKRKGLSTLLADEGGLSPAFATGREALEFLTDAMNATDVDGAIALDIAATTLVSKDGIYEFEREGRRFLGEQLIDLIRDWSTEFAIVSVEDALAEEDWENWQLLTRELGNTMQIVGDDLFATNAERLQRGIECSAANAVLIKLNQNGTLTGTLEVIRAAKQNGFATIVSARSGETEDAFIADLAVGTAAGQIKIGSFRNSERLAKYNRLLQIARETDAPMASFHQVSGANGRG